jgi:hypothetical protein
VDKQVIDKIQNLIDDAMNTEVSKVTCIELNHIRASLDGYFYGGCLCSLSERYTFIKNYIEWFNKKKLNKDV